MPQRVRRAQGRTRRWPSGSSARRATTSAAAPSAAGACPGAPRRRDRRADERPRASARATGGRRRPAPSGAGDRSAVFASQPLGGSNARRQRAVATPRAAGARRARPAGRCCRRSPGRRAGRPRRRRAAAGRRVARQQRHRHGVRAQSGAARRTPGRATRATAPSAASSSNVGAADLAGSRRRRRVGRARTGGGPARASSAASAVGDVRAAAGDRARSPRRSTGPRSTAAAAAVVDVQLEPGVGQPAHLGRAQQLAGLDGAHPARRAEAGAPRERRVHERRVDLHQHRAHLFQRCRRATGNRSVPGSIRRMCAGGDPGVALPAPPPPSRPAGASVCRTLSGSVT